jgi:hypothetical protein
VNFCRRPCKRPELLKTSFVRHIRLKRGMPPPRDFGNYAQKENAISVILFVEVYIFFYLFRSHIINGMKYSSKK